MPIIFPNIEKSDKDGLLAISRKITPDYILSAYKSGIFPWPCAEKHILWFAPPTRAILPFDKLIISKRLKRHLNNKKYTFKVNTAFQDVIKNCATVDRPEQVGTWITSKIIDAYIELHKAGFAYSFEIFSLNDKLIGGLYGVKLNNYFAGESMFHLESNSSKFALFETVEFLKKEGSTWMDVQVTNPFLECFGVEEISRKKFMHMLNEELK